MIEEIYIAKESKKEQIKVTEIQLVAGSGIVGDRNFGESRWPGQNITFIESEEIESFNEVYGQNISMEATRRNVITKGVRLNELVGKKFTIGGIKFLGVELCEPCSFLGELLENKTISKKNVVKNFVHKGGLRADILSNGNLSVGMPID